MYPFTLTQLFSNSAHDTTFSAWLWDVKQLRKTSTILCSYSKCPLQQSCTSTVSDRVSAPGRDQGSTALPLPICWTCLLWHQSTTPRSFSVVAVSISPCCTTTTAAETEHKLDPRLKSRIEIKNMSRKEKPEADRAMEDTRTQCLKLQLTPPFSCQFEWGTKVQ